MPWLSWYLMPLTLTHILENALCFLLLRQGLYIPPQLIACANTFCANSLNNRIFSGCSSS